MKKTLKNKNKNKTYSKKDYLSGDGMVTSTWGPAMWHYLSTTNEIQEGADKLFESIKLGKIKIEIFKKYRLDDVVQAHKDLESRKIIGSAIIIP